MIGRDISFVSCSPLHHFSRRLNNQRETRYRELCPLGSPYKHREANVKMLDKQNVAQASFAKKWGQFTLAIAWPHTSAGFFCVCVGFCLTISEGSLNYRTKQSNHKMKDNFLFKGWTFALAFLRDLITLCKEFMWQQN